MKSAKEILKEMAFNKDAPSSTQRAFLKHLQKAMDESKKAEVIPMAETDVSPSKQLSFDFVETKDFSKTKKSS